MKEACLKRQSATCYRCDIVKRAPRASSVFISPLLSISTKVILTVSREPHTSQVSDTIQTLLLTPPSSATYFTHSYDLLDSPVSPIPDPAPSFPTSFPLPLRFLSPSVFHDYFVPFLSRIEVSIHGASFLLSFIQSVSYIEGFLNSLANIHLLAST